MLPGLPVIVVRVCGSVPVGVVQRVAVGPGAIKPFLGVVDALHTNMIGMSPLKGALSLVVLESDLHLIGLAALHTVQALALSHS